MRESCTALSLDALAGALPPARKSVSSMSANGPKAWQDAIGFERRVGQLTAAAGGASSLETRRAVRQVRWARTPVKERLIYEEPSCPFSALSNGSPQPPIITFAISTSFGMDAGFNRKWPLRNTSVPSSRGSGMDYERYVSFRKCVGDSVT